MSVLIIDGKKNCSKCKISKDVIEFYKSSRFKSGLDCRCISCINNNKDKQVFRRYYKNVSKLPNKMGITKVRLMTIKAKYGLSETEYITLLKSQDKRCAICKTPFDLNNPNQKRIHIDHCHITGKVRGVLCTSCNRGLGGFKDRVIFLRKAIDYLITKG